MSTRTSSAKTTKNTIASGTNDGTIGLSLTAWSPPSASSLPAATLPSAQVRITSSWRTQTSTVPSPVTTTSASSTRTAYVTAIGRVGAGDPVGALGAVVMHSPECSTSW